VVNFDQIAEPKKLFFYKQTIHWKRAMKPIYSCSLFQTSFCWWDSTCNWITESIRGKRTQRMVYGSGS